MGCTPESQFVKKELENKRKFKTIFIVGEARSKGFSTVIPKIIKFGPKLKKISHCPASKKNEKKNY